MAIPLPLGATPAGPTGSTTGGAVTLLQGSTFAVSDGAGNMTGARADGMFFQDTRILSTWRLLVDDVPVEPLAVVPESAWAATFVGRAPARGGSHEPTIVVTRRRSIGAGLREEISVANHGTEPSALRIMLEVDADFADLFDVKEGKPSSRHEQVQRHGEHDVRWTVSVGGGQRGVAVTSDDGLAVVGGLLFDVVVPEQGQWRTVVEVSPSVDDHVVDPAIGRPVPVEGPAPVPGPGASTVVTAGHEPLQQALRQSIVDLGALRIKDPVHGVEVVAAGAPWFMALFGRDSILSAFMALPFDPSLAMGTLTALAGYQGTRVDAASEEEPGRILHEIRRGVDPSRALGGRSVYYGTADATPLFVMLLDEAARWGADPDRIRALLPAADAALEWIQRYGDADGDGFVEYRRKTDRGLLNQAWKDSHDSIHFASGRLAEAPIAVVEVQAYVYGAYRARAHLAAIEGDDTGRRHWLAAARTLRARFDEAFWLPERGHYALALDADKRPVDSLASNAGHALWTGIALPERVAPLVERLGSEEMFSGWGVRTLASSMARYNPASYHNGSVWPHDNALVVAGLMRAGCAEAAARVSSGLIAAGAGFGGRLPELFCGFSRDGTPVPVPYPASCSPQAWAAATPMMLTRAHLGLHPCVPHGVVAVDPRLPGQWGRLRLSGLRLGRHVLDVDTAGDPVVTEREGDGSAPLAVVASPHDEPGDSEA